MNYEGRMRKVLLKSFCAAQNEANRRLHGKAVSNQLPVVSSNPELIAER
jgi:hypothetical protein